MAERWIARKDEGRHDVKSLKSDVALTAKEKTKLTIYIPRETWKRLWYNRAETGQPISTTVTELIVEHFKKK